MNRRKYEMGKRAAAVERTRRRILEATMAVHDEQGIAAGRWPDIAERAGVSLATLYRHFPTQEELVTACGELTMRLVEPPDPESAAEVFAGLCAQEDRIERLVRETFGFYERAGRVVDNVRRDRQALPVLEDAHARLEAGLEALAREALAPLGAGRGEIGLARALTDVRVWESLRQRGCDAEEAIATAARVLTCALGAG